MKLTPLTSETLKNLDATAATAGLNPCVLMERAGMALADFLQERLKGEEKVCFLCGPGNNGGDGFVAARHLAHRGFDVTVVCTSKRRKGVAKDNRRL
ncbi:bifunctional ADP-dependent NAD(P)H-hydrate dehydratase/NAD(P)H-hydrate epimerase, partial [Candidatus Woesearchaeota archaeon]|nr:bifunctional ADP-dependent NAD(P)H-hydrate dehydratase/NAD(P)H-hydrate epimerase [Candidatus Woesearchaeota archaeon]